MAYASTRRIRSVCASPAGASRRVHAQWLLVSRPSQHCLSRAYEQAVVIAHLAQHKEGRVAQSCNRPDGRRALFPIFENNQAARFFVFVILLLGLGLCLLNLKRIQEIYERKDKAYQRFIHLEKSSITL